ncbi:MAG: PAS domain S-box protein, partial [Ignavibacteria bacterium]|nr:PAS domain S-box protein [Ignavibacteria bacterium]
HRSLKGREFECEVTLNRVVVGKNQYLLALVRDISSKKQALKEITHLAQAIQSIDEAVAIWDFNQNITFVNKAFERLFGYSIDEIIGKPISIIRSEETQKIGIDNEIIDTIKANKIWRGEVWNQTKEGKKILVGLTVSPFVDVNGEICACISVEIDLTERKMIEQKLHESNEMFNCLVNSIADAIFTLDKENKMRALYGRWKEENSIDDKLFLNKTCIEIFGEEKGKFHLEMIERCYKQGNCTYEFELDKFGFNLILQTKLSTLKDIEGNIIGLVGIARDITKQKHLETELRKFMWTVEQSPISIVVTDLNGQILYANSFASKITGYSLDEIIGKNPRIFKSGLTPTKTYEELWGTLLRGETWSGEFANRKKNGEIYWESALITPLKDEKGRIINYIAIKRDITKEKELINELVEAKESAEQLNELKNYLLMNLSHEFRTPLNGIIGYSQYLMMTSDNSDLQQIARIIYISGHRLLYSVNLVIDFALQSAGYIKTKPTKFDIVELVRDVFEHWKFYFFDKEIETYIESNEPAIIVNLDETIARTIISNIINNAFKFTREGKVEVIINRIEKVGKGFVEIQVIDTGIGIPEDKIPLIWKEFYQVSQGMNREFEGQGLGLSVAKKYVKLLGGEIYVQSQLGKGSNFTILCPIEIED